MRLSCADSNSYPNTNSYANTYTNSYAHTNAQSILRAVLWRPRLSLFLR